MDVHRARQRGVGRLGRHDVQYRVDRLVAADPEDGGPEDLVTVGVDDDLHKALRLTLFHGSTDPGHRTLPEQSLAARRADLADGHPGAAQRWIDVERVGGDAVA